MTFDTFQRSEPCPIGQGLYARLDALVDPRVRLRIRMLWLFGGYLRRRPSR